MFLSPGGARIKFSRLILFQKYRLEQKQHGNFNKLLLLRFWNLHGSRESGFSFSILDWRPIVLNPAVSSADMWIYQFA